MKQGQHTSKFCPFTHPEVGSKGLLHILDPGCGKGQNILKTVMLHTKLKGKKCQTTFKLNV